MSDLPVQGAEEYLGDGLYVSFDGFQILLRAPRPEGDHYIALEPVVYVALRDYIKTYPRLAAHMKER